MKRLLLLLFVLTVGTLGGCSTPEPPRPSPELISFGQAYARAWSSQDARDFATYFAENGELVINDGPAAVGRDAIREVAQSYMSDLPDMLVAMDSLVLVDGQPRFHWTLTGTHALTGSQIHISGFEDWTLDETGNILRSEGHMDADAYARQVTGEVPAV